ncbi:LLM class flavin-dependent oxidoreductase [Corynebacterium sp. 320]|uniref:LLM class flavin-dependent oxidoreductase n=1 Tax=Corynebacterium TaxID=1716 RepID=UPI00125CC1FB|nr:MULTISPECIES: LLM class flavin-dependent oxidoreductase [Corynebacterium]KAB1501439.1 LLM class flavin-dependent oxidoreductase [Corynebacterium sp. 320]KAB1551736.1 LLM class flavin-dependent oxidoreductase [Corynebacterium sp. 319]KAB3525797.1 LLM class flavin-dependent oxidoreductase [Corynebacterium sp. 250]KAB3538726.1 LLM class flavin-dependent oxidoreductase [Corynebacterium sp. 366]QNP92683.1 LLM class flavin-dependent oxidoreductase [Corynebacterium zhongnanshanii]
MTDSHTSPSRVPLSLIDFANIYRGESAADAFARSVTWAQRAESLGFKRIWYSEHHNMPSIASSAPAVLIAHVAAHTASINLGAGGVMLPNHSPLVIAEQFGTLAELHPGRIDLGLGRAPGTDQMTMRALRRDVHAADSFPQDVQELDGYLTDNSLLPGINAVPGRGTNVPLYILGSSLFGAQLAAQLGLPYSFASHFAPGALTQAVQVYRDNYQPSERFPEPYVIAAVNVTAADSEEIAAEHDRRVRRSRVRAMAGKKLTDAELDLVMDSPAGQRILDMLRYTAKGTGEQVVEYLEEFVELSQADELMVALQSPSTPDSLRNMEILAQHWFA